MFIDLDYLCDFFEFDQLLFVVYVCGWFFCGWCLVIVGLRYVDCWVLYSVEQIVSVVVCVGFSIVFGFVFGVDIIVYCVVVDEGEMIVVFGCGFVVCYLKQYYDFVVRIVESGVVVMEFLFDV